MRAAGFRPATPALVQMLEISTDHACNAVGKHTPIGLRSPQRFRCHRASMLLAAARTISRAGTRHQIAIEAAAAGYSPFRDFVHLQACRRRPTMGVACRIHGRHPQTFTTTEVRAVRDATE